LDVFSLGYGFHVPGIHAPLVAADVMDLFALKVSWIAKNRVR
jgi:hypothetical protein